MIDEPKALPVTTTSRLARIPFGSGLGLFILYIIMVIVISRLSPFFLGSRNLVNLPVSVAVIGMIAVFSTLLMVGGGLDLSVGANTALVGVFFFKKKTAFDIVGAAAFGLTIGLL